MVADVINYNYWRFITTFAPWLVMHGEAASANIGEIAPTARTCRIRLAANAAKASLLRRRRLKFILKSLRAAARRCRREPPASGISLDIVLRFRYYERSLFTADIRVMAHRSSITIIDGAPISRSSQ